MLEVDDLFEGRPCKTRLWISDRVKEEFSRRATRHKSDMQRLLARLQRYTQNGFEPYEGEIVRHEWDGVYRIGHPADLFRIIGFYADGKKDEFVAIDCFEKRGQRLSSAERARIDAVAKVRQNQQWKRRTQHGNYPRLAQDT